MTATELPVDHLLTFTAHTAPATMIPGAPQGTRGVIAASGGVFEGPRLRGTIAAGGGDWFTVRPSGSLRVDARLLLVTDDEVAILLTYTGVAVPGEGGMAIRVAALFEAPEGPYAWLNDVQGVAVGQVVAGGVRYEVYGLH